MNQTILRGGLLAAVFAAFVLAPLAAQATEDPVLAAKRSGTLKYGITSEITDLLKALEAEKQDSHNEEILSLMNKTKDQNLRQSILGYFAHRAWPGAQDAAVGIVKGWKDAPLPLVIAAVDYGTAIKGKSVLEAALPILGEEEPELKAAIVKLVGAAGGEAESQRLIDIYKDDGSSENLKQAVLLSLGSSGGAAAVDLLMSVLDDKAEKKFSRIYACDSLGRLADPKAIDSIVQAANDDDPNLRYSALGALASFDDPRARDMIVEGLRDSFDNSRIQAAKSIGKLRIQEGEGALLYKAANDSNLKVKEESLKALAELGSDAAWAAIIADLSDRKVAEALRLDALRLILGKKRVQGYQAVRDAIAAEAKEKGIVLLQRMALAVSENENPELSDLAVLFMNHPDFIMRAYGIEWVRRNKAASLKSELERLAKDPADMVRKRAEAALASF